jgi:hypothetical protein
MQGKHLGCYTLPLELVIISDDDEEEPMMVEEVPMEEDTMLIGTSLGMRKMMMMGLQSLHQLHPL